MNDRTSRSASWLPILAVSIPLILIFLSVLSVPLTAAQSLGLTPGETTSWIMALYGLNSLLALAISLQRRQPLLLTGNLFALAFIASLGDQVSYPELVGDFVAAGAAVLFAPKWEVNVNPDLPLCLAYDTGHRVIRPVTSAAAA